MDPVFILLLKWSLQFPQQDGEQSIAPSNSDFRKRHVIRLQPERECAGIFPALAARHDGAGLHPQVFSRFGCGEPFVIHCSAPIPGGSPAPKDFLRLR